MSQDRLDLGPLSNYNGMMDLEYWKQIPDIRQSKYPPQFRTEPGESWQDRHERRYAFAFATIVDLRRWCQERNLELFMAEHGYRINIRFRSELRPFCYWWPANAKLIFDSRWEHGIHCHDTSQLICELTDYLQHRREIKAPNLFLMAKTNHFRYSNLKHDTSRIKRS